MFSLLKLWCYNICSLKSRDEMRSAEQTGFLNYFLAYIVITTSAKNILRH